MQTVLVPSASSVAVQSRMRAKPVRATAWIGPVGIASGCLLVVWPKPFLPLAVALWIFLLPVTLSRSVRRSRQWLVGLGLAAILGALVTDLMAQTPILVLAKSVTAIASLVLAYCFYSWFWERARFVDRSRAVLAYLVGWALAVSIFFTPQPGFSLWKYNYAPIVALTVAWLAWRLSIAGRIKSASVLVLSAAILMALTGSRNLALALLVAMLANSAQATSRRPTLRQLVLATSAVLAAVTLLSIALGHGWFGRSAQAKWKDEGGSPVAVVFNGRPELFVSLPLVLEHPLGGEGSEAIASSASASAAARLMDSVGVRSPDQVLQETLGGGIQLHSMLFDSWIHAGVISAAFILVALALCIKALASGIPDCGRPSLLAAVAAAILMWDLLFSPITWYSGVEWGFLLAVATTSPSRGQGGGGEV